jgi:biotin carboxylase
VEIPIYYDSLIAKVVCRGINRQHAIRRTRSALAAFEIEGIETNLDLLRKLTATRSFEKGRYDTNFIANFLSETA